LYDEPYNHAARISPDGKEIVFSDNHNKILKLNIETKAVSVLRETREASDELLEPKPGWSPDGRYIAYLRNNGWELPGSIWIMQADGTGDRCLVPCCELKKEYSTKNFLWHPEENKIFYVYGYTYGTVSVGGNIYLTDLNANKRIIVAADTEKREEIYSEFRVVGDKLYYKVAHFSVNYEQTEYTLHHIDIKNIE